MAVDTVTSLHPVYKKLHHRLECVMLVISRVTRYRPRYNLLLITCSPTCVEFIGEVQ